LAAAAALTVLVTFLAYAAGQWCWYAYDGLTIKYNDMRSRQYRAAAEKIKFQRWQQQQKKAEAQD